MFAKLKEVLSNSVTTSHNKIWNSLEINFKFVSLFNKKNLMNK